MPSPTTSTGTAAGGLGTEPPHGGSTIVAPILVNPSPPVVHPTRSAAPGTDPVKPGEPVHEKHWYDRIQIRGYTQLRYNRLWATNDKFKNDFADKSIAAGSGFFIRRGRLIVQGDVHDHLFLYFQPDFAGAANGDALNLAQLRDLYGDISIDKKKEFRFRVGQSKVPFGWENMQSSQNRAPLDRSDAINTAAPSERDLGIFAYWAPEHVRKRFKMLVDSGLKGSGDYGVVGLGVYNGQALNFLDRNSEKHFVGRVTWPFEFGDQVVEVGVAGYYGKYRIKRDAGYSAHVAGGSDDDFDDGRGEASFTLYPKPIGLQVEYTVGRGPELDPGTKIVRTKTLYGGYAMLMARFGEPEGPYGAFTPYVRFQAYDGGRKSDANAAAIVTKELEAGLEWQVWKSVELTVAYANSQRTVNWVRQDGQLLRTQIQINY
ncbi:MAG: porin [Polyangiaceae bacterium]